MAKNVFETIGRRGEKGDFEPRITPDFKPSRAPAGSAEKIKVLQYRVQMGLPLFHPDDNSDCYVQRNAGRRKTPPPPEDDEEERKAG